MKVRVLERIHLAYLPNPNEPGDVIDVPEEKAQRMIAAGQVEKYTEAEEEPKPKRRGRKPKDS